MKSPEVFRGMRGCMYAAYLIAGIWCGIYASQVLQTVGFSKYSLTGWSVFLILGGLCGLYSVITDKWYGEFVGLPLLITAFFTYSVSATWAAWSDKGGDASALTLTFIFLGLTFSCIERVRVIRRLSFPHREKDWQGVKRGR